MESKLLSNRIEMKLITLIKEGIYLPGDKLPNELELSNELGVARSTIREAIKTLSTKNVVTIKRGIGTFVSESPGLIDEPFGFEFIQSDYSKPKMRGYVQTISASFIKESFSRQKMIIKPSHFKIDGIGQQMNKSKDIYFSALKTVDEFIKENSDQVTYRLMHTLLMSYGQVVANYENFDFDSFLIAIRYMNEYIDDVNYKDAESCLEEIIDILMYE